MFLVLLVCFMLVISCLAQESDVQILTVDNFEHLTQASTGATTGDWFIKFYAPWCGHCKRMSPAWDETAARLAGEVNVAKVDVTANKNLGTRFDVKGFPTLLYIRQGKVYKYKGKRDADSLVSFIQEKKYLDEEYEPKEVPKPLGIFGPLFKVFEQFFELIFKNIKSGDFFSPVMLAMYVLLVFIGMFVLVLAIPAEDVPPPRMASKKED